MADQKNAQSEHIFRWDLDKTYLATEFDRVRDLIRTFTQSAEEKSNVPGAVALLRALLTDHSDDEGGIGRRSVYFISGSPRQMRNVLERKLALDGIKPDAFVLKPNLENLIAFRFKAIRGQVGYKLRALLEHQQAGLVPETLFGDDAEQDAVIYSIYAEILAGRIHGKRLERLLETGGVYPKNFKAIMEASESIEIQERVNHIFIILDRLSPMRRFSAYSPRLVPVYNYFQAALVLFQDNLLNERDVVDICIDMIERDEYNPFALTNSMQDVVRRGFLNPEVLTRVSDAMSSQEARLGEVAGRLASELAMRIEALKGYDMNLPSRPSPADVDYHELLKTELAARKHHKKKKRPVSRTLFG